MVVSEEDVKCDDGHEANKHYSQSRHRGSTNHRWSCRSKRYGYQDSEYAAGGELAFVDRDW